MPENTPDRILLIDDQEDEIGALESALVGVLEGQDVIVDVWIPEGSEIDPDDLLDEQVQESTALVITDYDLTKKGMRGFQGVNVRNWCQSKLIPVGDFSRGHLEKLPDEPDLFEMRVPVTNAEVAAEYIGEIYNGFSSVKSSVQPLVQGRKNISTITALVLGRPHLDSALSRYYSRLATSNPWIRSRLQELAADEASDQNKENTVLLTYVIGHALLNLILEFPGPILGRDVLAAYLGVAPTEVNSLVESSGLRAYDGPFSEIETRYWREDVDQVLDAIIESDAIELPEDQNLWRRHALETLIGRDAARHDCVRQGCEGKRGGFWCPFSKRAVCNRSDCSEPTTGWIPDGADLCRVEREFFDEFAPLMGL